MNHTATAQWEPLDHSAHKAMCSPRGSTMKKTSLPQLLQGVHPLCATQTMLEPVPRPLPSEQIAATMRRVAPAARNLPAWLQMPHQQTSTEAMSGSTRHMAQQPRATIKGPPLPDHMRASTGLSGCRGTQSEHPRRLSRCNLLTSLSGKPVAPQSWLP